MTLGLFRGYNLKFYLQPPVNSICLDNGGRNMAFTITTGEAKYIFAYRKLKYIWFVAIVKNAGEVMVPATG